MRQTHLDTALQIYARTGTANRIDSRQPDGPPDTVVTLHAQQPFAKHTRYERFTTRVVVVSSSLMLLFTAVLHVCNYDKETQTSSTSGTHSDFSNSAAGAAD